MSDMLEVEQTKKKPRLFVILGIVFTFGAGLVYLAVSEGDDQSRLEGTTSSIVPPAQITEVQLGDEAPNSVDYIRNAAAERQEREQLIIEGGGITIPPIETNTILSRPNETDEDAVILPVIDGTDSRQASSAPIAPLPSLKTSSDGNTSKVDTQLTQFLLSGWVPTRSASIQVTKRVKLDNEASLGSPNQNGQQTLTPDSIQPPENAQVIKAGEILLALSKSGANSDVGGEVIVSLVGSQLDNNRLIGSYERRGKNLFIRFNQLSVDGRQGTVGINAIAVNLETLTPGVRSTYESRWVERYGLPFLASLIGGFGEAVSLGTTRTIIGNGQSETLEERDFDLEDQLIISAGAASENLSAALLANAANVQPLSTLKVNEPIGIMFLQDVYVSGNAISGEVN